MTTDNDNTLRVGMGGYGELRTFSDNDKTARTVPTLSMPDADFEGLDDFVLKGKAYKKIKCLSDESGEAQVFLVGNAGKEYVLKLYYPNFSINKKMLKIVANMNFEMIVRLYDFGKTYVDGKNRDYELMEYLKGGTQVNYSVGGNINVFRRIALQAAASLAYCHNCNIIHKDIKPSNFFFRDETHTEVVLGDFGISSIMDGDKKTLKTSQARTPLYAAPEMYNDVIDGVVEITPAVDFYSLGITLMTIWKGEAPMATNERAMMRRKSEGRLPGIDELPERVKMIVQGLTSVNPASRWGYDEVESWFEGGSPKVDMSSPVLRYKSFVVDPERNLVADNVHELIPLLLDNERVACNYLYSGRIAEWLEQSGNVKLAVTLRDIVTNKYPVNQMAGLWSAVYAMESSYPYKDLHGNMCDNIHSVAISMLSYADEYSVALRNIYDPLWIYIESHTKCNMERLRGYFSSDKGKVSRKDILKVVYEIDPDIPLLARHQSSSIKEIVRSFGGANLTEDEWQALTDGRLLAWMYSHETSMACESLRILIDGQPYSRQLAYKVLYNLDRMAAYDLKDADTPLKVGELLAEQLRQLQNATDEEVALAIADFSDPDGRFAYFAQLHGWTKELAESRACFDMKSPENKDRLGAYDMRTAAYRFCKILGEKPGYLLSDGTIVTEDTYTEPKYMSLVRTELRCACFAQWMSVAFHEDPNKDFSETYSYERSLEQWLLALGNIDPQQKYYKRFENAKEETKRKCDELRDYYNGVKTRETLWRSVFYALTILWLLMLVFVGISNKEYVLEHSFISIALPLGGVSALLMMLKAYFRGYGFLMSLIWGIGGFLTSYIPIWLLKLVDAGMPSLFVPAVVLITLVYAFICHRSDFNGVGKEDKKLIGEVLDGDINSRLLEPLYYSFKAKTYKYKGTKFGLMDDIYNQINSVAGESVIHYAFWCLMPLLFVLEIVVFSPKLMDFKTPDLGVNPTKVIQQLESDIE